MQVTETLNEGLKRALKVVVDAQELETDLSQKLTELSGKVRLKGFRPGKVPAVHLRRVYGKSVMAEMLQKKVDDSAKQAIADRQLKPAYAPEIKLLRGSGRNGAGHGRQGRPRLHHELRDRTADRSWKTSRPSKSTKLVAAGNRAEDVDEALGRVASQHQGVRGQAGRCRRRNGRQGHGFVCGKIDGAAFEGGTAEDVPLELGSGQFLPGFEDQLIGAKAGDELKVNVTFPTTYGVEKLAGKPAEFAVSVKSVEAAKRGRCRRRTRQETRSGEPEPISRAASRTVSKQEFAG